MGNETAKTRTKNSKKRFSVSYKGKWLPFFKSKPEKITPSSIPYSSSGSAGGLAPFHKGYFYFCGGPAVRFRVFPLKRGNPVLD
jgi:hypothetical protein